MRKIGALPQDEETRSLPDDYLFGPLRFHLPSFQRVEIRGPLPPEKAARWADEIRGHMKKGPILAGPLEKLIAKLGSTQTNLFSKFARDQLRPLYRKLYAARYAPRFISAELSTLHWRSDILASLHPRIPLGVDREMAS